MVQSSANALFYLFCLFSACAAPKATPPPAAVAMAPGPLSPLVETSDGGPVATVNPATTLDALSRPPPSD